MDYLQAWKSLAGEMLIGLRADGCAEIRSLQFFDGTIQTTAGGGGGSSAWSAITGKPTTLAGYGITDALPSSTVLPVTDAGSTHHFLTAYNATTGVFSDAQPAYSDISGTPAAALPLGGGTLTGALLFTDNTLDIGASGATRPRTLYAATSIVTPSLVLTGTKKTSIASGATGSDWTLTLPTTAGTNLYVLQTDGSGNASWVAQTGGTAVNSDLQYSPDNDPGSPTSYDDEFNGSSLGGSWAIFNTSLISSTTVANSSVVLNMTVSAGQLAGYKQSFVPGASNFTFEGKLMLGGLNCTGGNTTQGLVVSDGTKYLYCNFAIFSNNTTPSWNIEYWTTANNYSSAITSGNMSLPIYTGWTSMAFPYVLPVWFRLQKSGTDLIFSFSFDGFTYISHTASAAFNNISTISGIGICCGNGASLVSTPRFLHFRKIA
jgi:hypothetical protein